MCPLSVLVCFTGEVVRRIAGEVGVVSEPSLCGGAAAEEMM